MKTKTTIKNSRRIRRKLQRLDKNISAPVREALLAGGEKVRDDARARVPKRTGTLAKAISVGKKSNGFRIEVGIRGKRARRKAYYAHFVEFGTVRTPARPYLEPAFEANRKAIVREVDRALDRVFERVSRERA